MEKEEPFLRLHYNNQKENLHSWGLFASLTDRGWSVNYRSLVVRRVWRWRSDIINLTYVSETIWQHHHTMSNIAIGPDITIFESFSHLTSYRRDFNTKIRLESFQNLHQLDFAKLRPLRRTFHRWLLNSPQRAITDLFNVSTFASSSPRFHHREAHSTLKFGNFASSAFTYGFYPHLRFLKRSTLITVWQKPAQSESSRFVALSEAENKLTTWSWAVVTSGYDSCRTYRWVSRSDISVYNFLTSSRWRAASSLNRGKIWSSSPFTSKSIVRDATLDFILLLCQLRPQRHFMALAQQLTEFHEGTH